MVLTAFELFEPVAEQNNIDLSWNIKPGCRYCKCLEIQQRTITNLIDNAIKYTHSQDSTTVTFGFDNNCLCLTVCDSGIGIAADQTESIFCRF